MSPGSIKTIVGLLVTAPLVAWSGTRFVRSRSVGAALQLVGALGLLTVAGIHVCERLGLFPSMGWGRPDTPGHYLDLGAAAVGLTLFTVGLFVARGHDDRSSASHDPTR